MGRVFTNGLGDLGSIPGHVIPKTLKMVLDTSLLNTQQYKVRIKGKVEQSRERSSALPYILPTTYLDITSCILLSAKCILTIRLLQICIIYCIIHITAYNYLWGVPMALCLTCWTLTTSLNLSYTIKFTFGLMPLGKAWTLLPFQQWVK